jgi:hypothetical protein
VKGTFLKPGRVAVILAVVGFGVALWAGLTHQSDWFVLVPAFFIGLVAAFWWGDLTGLAKGAVDSLGWAVIILLPLTLPLIAAVIVGSPAFGLLLQLLLLPPLVVFAWRAILVPSCAEVTTAWKQYEARGERLNLGRTARRIAFPLLLCVTFVVATLLIGVRVDPLEDRPGTSTDFLTIAFGLWLSAIVLRVAGYAISWPRTVVAVFGIAAVIWAAIWAGILPGYNDLEGRWWIQVILWGLPLTLVLTALIEAWAVHSEEIRRWLDEHKFSDVRGLWLRGAGDVTSIAAAVAVVAAGIAGYFEVHGETDSTIASGASAAKKVADPLQISRRELAEAYAPRLIFTTDERWRPIDVGAFLDDAQLTGRYGITRKDRVRFKRHRELPRQCPPLVEAPCFDLTITCREGEDCPEPEGTPRAAYVRVLKDNGGTPGRPNPFAVPDGVDDETAAMLESTSVLIQYWLFYRFNEWNRPTLSGRLAGRHEGDWEAVMVGLSAEKPEFVAFSAHCAGTWRPWDEVEVAETHQGPRTHPLIAVAEGSHANYVETQDRRSPDWAGCAGIGKGTTTLLGYASNIRDKTENGYTRRLKGDELKLVSGNAPPMSFPGTWGARTQTLLINKRTHKLENKKGGPETPTLQPLWIDPLRKVFCSNWDPRRCPER